MKFTYIDESEGQGGRVVVSAGIVVDSTRMHLTKADWAALLERASNRLPAPLREFKASDLYRGAGRWYRMPAADRAQVMNDVIEWIAERRHSVVYSAILETAFDSSERDEISGLRDSWCAANQHVLLSLQRCHQALRAPKGQTVVIFDQGRHSEHLVGFAQMPPAWTDEYYGRRSGAPPLDMLVDVPYFVDSEHALLVQAADLCAYILRRHVELTDLNDTERYSDERSRISSWAQALARRAPLQHMWPQRDRLPAHDVFRDLAPPSLVNLRA